MSPRPESAPGGPEPRAPAYTLIPDLAARVDELVAQAPHPTGHVQGRAVFTDEHVKVLAFPFEAGQALEEHTAPHPIALHFLRGEADVTLGPDAVEARAGTWVHLPPRLPHSIRARTDTVMLLLVFQTGGGAT